MSQLVLKAIVTVPGYLLVLVVLLRRVGDPAAVAEWARRHGVELTDANRAMAAYFVHLLLTLRVLGGCGGMIITGLLGAAVAPDTPLGMLPWVGALVGWMLGAWWADRHIGAPARRRPAATLVPRRLADYLPTPLRLAPALGAGLAVAAAVVVATTEADASRRWLLAEALGAVVVAGGAALAQRAVVARPQPAMAPARVEADDAARSSTVHHLGGGATAATLALAGMAATAAPATAPPVLIGLALVAPLVAWRMLAFRGWRVRRGASAGAALAR